jgi:excinuclease ABC subunit A
MAERALPDWTFSPCTEIDPDVIDRILTHQEEERFLILTAITADHKDEIVKKIQLLAQQGYSRIKIDDRLELMEDAYDLIDPKKKIYLVIDRVTADTSEDNLTRLGDSVENAFFEGKGECIIERVSDQKQFKFSNKFELDGMTFEEPSVHLFAFNNPVGACKTCEGFGSVIGIDEDLVIPDKSLSVYEGCVAPWKGEKMGEWREMFVKNALKFDFPVHRPYYDLNEKQKDQLWKGTKYTEGIDAFFRHVEEQTYKIQYRVMLSRYRGKTSCPDCRGTRLRKDASYVQVVERILPSWCLFRLSVAASFSISWPYPNTNFRFRSASCLKFNRGWDFYVMWGWATLR